MVYFIQDPTTKSIKIGYSKNPPKRLRDLACGPTELTLLGTMRGTRGTEQLIHAKFDRTRVRGEWFRPSTELLHFIQLQKLAYLREVVTRSTFALSHGLRLYRNQLNMTQQEVAKSAGVRQATVSKAENHKSIAESDMSVQTMYDLCAALGLELVLRPRVRKELDDANKILICAE